MLITSGGKIIRTSAKDISVIGRNTRGVRLINLEGDEKVLAVSRAPLDTQSGQGEEDGLTEPSTPPSEPSTES
jgi:DNA gyrase subunit A